jgi:carbonic anhydrase
MADSEDDVLSRMMSNNREWAAKVRRDNPGSFERLAKQQTPRVLWIGCSDSRLPGNESIDALCEINVIEQVRHVTGNSIVQQAWRRGQEVSVHGWIYGLEDGLLHDLGVTVNEARELDEKVKTALAAPRAVKIAG